MKNFTTFFAFAVLAIAFSACELIYEETSPKPDPVAFTIAFEGDQQLLHQQERIQVESKRDEEIRKVSFYLDGTLIGEDTSAPFEHVLQTEQYADGAHTLRVVVEDKQGRKTESSSPLIISNTLFTVSLPEVYKKPEIPYQDASFIDALRKNLWVYLTDDAGNMIGKAVKLSAGAQASWKRPKGFTGSFNYHELWHSTSTVNPDLNYHNLYTYTNFPGSHFNKKPDYLEPTGSATVSFVDDIGNDPLTYVKNRRFEARLAHLDGDTEVVQVPVYTENDKVLAYLEGWDETGEQHIYYALADVSAGDAEALAYSNFQKSKVVPISWSFESDGQNVFAAAYWIIDGYPTLLDFAESRYGFQSPWYFMPADEEIAVAYVKARVSYGEGGTYTYVLPEARMRSSLDAVAHSATVFSPQNESFQFRVQGSPDVVYAYWTTPGDPFRRDYLYAYQYQDPTRPEPFTRPSPPDTLLRVIPSLGRALGETSPALATVHSVDYQKIQGYQAFISRVVEQPANNKDFLENTGGYTANAVPFEEE